MEKLIYDYRMMGFDNPVVFYNKTIGQWVLDINDPCGEWKLIKGSSAKDCLAGAISWVTKNWSKVQRERLKLIRSYPLSNANKKRRV